MRDSLPILVPTHPRVAELEQLGDEIAELAAHLSAATARLLALIREFDAKKGWNTGFRSCADWLSWRIGLDLSAAREHVRVARALAGLPMLADAFGRGELSYSKVRALTRVAIPETEARLLAIGRAGATFHVERIVRSWRRVDRLAEAREIKQQHAARGLHIHQDDDGMFVIRGRLEPEVGALVVKALAAAREKLYPWRPAGDDTDKANEAPTIPQQHADGLGLIAESALHHELDPGAPGERYQVVLHVDADVLANVDRAGQTALEDGTRVSAETSQRLTCDSNRILMSHGAAGRAVEVAARTRTIPPALRRALQHRDQGCRFPGCSVRVGQGHHIRHWAQGGPTTLSNLVMLCRRHHRSVHEEGYGVARDVDGAIHFWRPNGQPLLDAPPPPLRAGDVVAPIETVNDANGLRITPRTGLPTWTGERLDLGWAINALHPEANPLPHAPA